MRLPHFISMCLLCFSSGSYSAPLYWMAQKDNLHLLIIGSIHVGKRDMYPLPEAVQTFFHHSDGLILEADLRESTNVHYPQATTTSSKVLNEKQQTQLKRIAKQMQLSDSQLLSLPPWIAAITLQVKQMEVMGYQPTLGVDQYLLGKAIPRQIPIMGLETAQYQINLLAGMAEDGKELLESTLSDWPSTRRDMRCLVKSWEAGDKQNLLRFMQKSDMSSTMGKALTVTRNRAWVNKIVSGDFIPQQKGHYLMAVGTMHLLGKDSVISLLKKAGFTITQSANTQTADCRFSVSQ